MLTSVQKDDVYCIQTRTQPCSPPQSTVTSVTLSRSAAASSHHYIVNRFTDVSRKVTFPEIHFPERRCHDMEVSRTSTAAASVHRRWRCWSTAGRCATTTSASSTTTAAASLFSDRVRGDRVVSRGGALYSWPAPFRDSAISGTSFWESDFPGNVCKPVNRRPVHAPRRLARPTHEIIDQVQVWL